MTVIRTMVMRSVLLLLLVQCASGCAQKIDPDLFVSIENAGQIELGDTVDEVRTKTGAAGVFAFQTRSDQGELFGLEYWVGSTNARVFMVYRDGTLQRISPARWGDVATRTKSSGRQTSVVVPNHPMRRLLRILNCDPLIGDELIAYAQDKHPGKPNAIPNVLIPAIITSIIMPPFLLHEVASDIEHHKMDKERALLRQRLAYNNISWGMTPEQVQAVYGEPYFEQSVGQVKGCVYGSKRLGQRIAVEYFDNQACAKYGPRFCPIDWTGELRKQVLSECDPGSLKEDCLPPYRPRQKK